MGKRKTKNLHKNKDHQKKSISRANFDKHRLQQDEISQKQIKNRYAVYRAFVVVGGLSWLSAGKLSAFTGIKFPEIFSSYGADFGGPLACYSICRLMNLNKEHFPEHYSTLKKIPGAIIFSHLGKSKFRSAAFWLSVCSIAELSQSYFNSIGIKVTTFDPLDFVAYGAGTGLAPGADYIATQKKIKIKLSHKYQHL